MPVAAPPPIQDPAPLCLGVRSVPSGQETCPSLGGNGSVSWAPSQPLPDPEWAPGSNSGLMFLLEGSLASWPLAQPGTRWGQGWEGIGFGSPFLFMDTGTISKQKKWAT